MKVIASIEDPLLIKRTLDHLAAFTFAARNPARNAELVWKTHLHFADGTTTHWVDTPVRGDQPQSRA